MYAVKDLLVELTDLLFQLLFLILFINGLPNFLN